VVKGKRCDIGLGSATLVTLAEARESAYQLRKIARAGGDPLAARRQERREVPTFEAAATQVHSAHSITFKNDRHRKQWLSSLKAVFDVFGGKRVDSVGSADILAALAPRWVSHAETSRRILQRVRVVFDWCKAQGFCSGDNPTDGITKVLPRQKPSRAHHAALPYRQVPSFIQELRTASASESVRLAFEFTILCATRTSETLKATWSEVDVQAQLWTVPANRMKAGIDHRIPLSARCIEILERAKALSNGGPYVFPGRSRNHPLSNMVFLMALRRMNRGNLTTHGFRSSFRDWAAERTNFPRAVCEAALAHTLRDKTEAAYNRSDLFERREELMSVWSAFATSKPADVVAIRA
jgi:integrase